MLIDQVPEKNDGSRTEQDLDVENSLEENVNNCQIFDLEDTKDDVLENGLCTRDLVILYENMDHYSKNNHISNNIIEKPSNQYVETVIYNDDLDSDVSDASDIYSNEDVHNVIMINDERIDLLNVIPSFQAALCHKYGNVNMETTYKSNEYHKHFLFSDPYIKEKLNIHSMSHCKYSDSTVIPASLLDYICCKRLEDNDSFYMDNVIKYVQHTIEQLKRISNGDYLTDTAKEKWREVKNTKKNDCVENALVSCADVPGRIKNKSRHFKTTWDDKVHSEMDITYIKKMLKKKIYLQVPKLLSGTYKLFGKYFDDKLIISCEMNKQTPNRNNINESRVNVILNLQCPKSSNMDTNIKSVMVLKSSLLDELKTEQCSVLEITSDNDEQQKSHEIENDIDDVILRSTPSLSYYSQFDLNNDITSEEYNVVDEITEPYPNTDELSYTMRRLNVHSPVLEESEDASTKKKRSPSRIRIKSPYENRSYVIEEKKRKKLLEIKEKREKKKLSMNENHKVTKPKYGKGAIMAHSSYSVTKLSITNKSFYNSIYGQSLDNKKFKKAIKKPKRDNLSSLDLDYDNEDKKDSGLIPNKNSQHFISRSYYLDDADTEIMHLPTKSDSVQDVAKDIGAQSTSTLSNDIDNLSIVKRLFTNTSVSDISGTDTMSSLHKQILIGANEDNKNNFLKFAQSTEAIVPTNTPTHNGRKLNDKTAMSTECRKNIDKIYDLMKIKNQLEPYDSRHNKSIATNCAVTKDSFSIQSCDSGSSNKHQLMSSITNKDINNDIVAVVPKVIINSKQRTTGLDNKVKKEVKKIDTNKIINNPLKAISQLLHDIDNVQKTRQKGGNERRSSKKSENVYLENKSKATTYKRNNEVNPSRLQPHKDRILQQNLTSDKIKMPQRLATEKPPSKIYRKNVIDIIDEVKELKGEAVRGPSKRSRLDNLAQPKKLYVQAHNEQYQNRYEKQFMTDRQRVSTFQLPNREKVSSAAIKRQKRVGDTSTLSTKQMVLDPAIEKCINSKTTYRDSLEEHEKKIPAFTKRPSSSTKTNPFLASPNKRNVAVEPTNNLYNRVTSVLSRTENNEKSRAPLIPVCIDLESVTSSPSVQGSNALGNKLHLMINSITNTNSTMNALAGIEEPIIKSDVNDKKPETDFHSLRDNNLSTSDYSIDVFKDKNIVTAVACISKDNQNNETDKSIVQKMLTYEVKDSESELHKLENALYNQISTGTFQKRLKIKKLTLTPKHSIQEAFVLNSGDTDTVLVKSKLSRKIDLSKTDIHEIKPFPVLSNMFINRRFPIQVSTVGYAFLKHYDHNISNLTGNAIVPLNDKSSKITVVKEGLPKIKELCHKSFQCSMNIKDVPQLTPNVRNDTVKEKYVAPQPGKNDCLSKSNSSGFEAYTERKFEEHSLNMKEEKTLKENYNDTETNLTANSDNISDSTSLDILVGLLNEIKKITSCQANLVRCSNENNSIPKNKELEVILNNVSKIENSPDVSINSSTSLISFINKQEDSKNPLMLSNYEGDNYVDIAKFGTKQRNLVNNIKRIYFDKEVTVKISKKDIRHTFTDVPSQFFITAANRNSFKSTNKPSSPSVTTLYDCSILHVNSSIDKITDLPKHKQEICVYNKNNVVNETENTRNYSSVIKKIIQNENKLSELDPMMKMKRDILVTIYSILVLTVFTALTFPDLLPPA